MNSYNGVKTVFATVLSATILSTLFLSPSVSYAQALEEIIVTAQRREQSVQEVPISLETFSGIEIQQQGYRTMDDLAEFSPSIEIEVRMQDQNVSIRGVGTAGASLALEQAAPTFVDGIVFGRTSMVKGALVDIERIEILRGPQPVFFGQNAVAGAFHKMAICEARLCSNSGSIAKRRNNADGRFVARPKGSPQIAHSCVA